MTFWFIPTYIFYIFSFVTAHDKEILIVHNHSEKQNKKHRNERCAAFENVKFFIAVPNISSELFILHSIDWNRNFRMSNTGQNVVILRKDQEEVVEGDIPRENKN